MNNKVKLKSRLDSVIRSCTMESDDNYILDSAGSRFLIGLNLLRGETREFERLDELISELSSAPNDDSRSINERRWLVLYDKHEDAVRAYLSIENAKMLRASRTE